MYFCNVLYYRRKILLALLQVFGGRLSAIQLQKYLFLFTRNQDVKAFDFVPYRYGCFSFQANQDISTMQKYGYVDYDDNSIWLLTKDDYINTLNMFDQCYLRQVMSEFGKMEQTELIRYTYQHYPYYAMKSHIAKSIMTKEEIDSIYKQQKKYDSSMLFTIGYEGLSLEAYINKLIINDIRLLCDVRKNAYSQKYGFSKAQLETACRGVDIKYVHVPQLGINSDQRQDLRSQKDYDILFDIYERTTLKENADALNYVRGLIDSEKRVALTCFEKDPKQCHRSRVAKALMALPNKDYSFKAL